MNEIIQAVFNPDERFVRTQAQWEYNKRQKLQISGVSLPQYFEGHFSNSTKGKAKRVIGENGLIEIPSEYFQPGKNIYCWIYIQDNSAEITVYQIVIPISERAEPTNDEPTPDQEDIIEQAIIALNGAVEDAENAADRAEEAAASIDEGMIADAVADYLDEHPVTVDETDPTVPEWAKQPTKPSYTASEVGAVPAEAGKGLSTNDYTTAEKEKLAGIEAGADKTPDLSGYATKTELNGKVDKVSGKGLSTNDYTTAEKDKLSGIEAGAQKNPDLSHYVTDSDYNPNSKTSDQTQAVGVDANGKLWTAPGGQGGTTDYDQLSNRPSINGHTLTGNQTAAQLGLATPSDIPAVPVQSVNGQTGAVVLSASDVGALPSGTAIPSKTSDLTNDSGFVNAFGAAAAAPVQSVNNKTGAVTLTAADVGAGTYSKPSTGIPKSDLASAVQTSLDKADTALQVVPSTYRTAAAQDTIDSGKIDKPSNPSSGAFLVYNGTAWVAQTLATWQGGSF